MFSEYAPRLLRRKWSHLGLSHLAGKENPTNEDVMKAIQGFGTALDQFVEELATMLTKPVELTQRAEMNVLSRPEVDQSNVSLAPDTPVSDLINQADFPNYYSTVKISNPDSEISSDNTQVEGGHALIVDGVANFQDVIVGGKLMTGDIVVDPDDRTTQTVLTGVELDSSGRLVFTTATVTVFATEAGDDTTIDICHECADECSECGLDATTGENTSPRTVTITLGGTIVDGGNATCDQAGCNAMLTSYILTQDQSDPCLYEYEGTVCGADTIRITYQHSTTSVIGAIAINAVPEVSWSLGLSAGYDCRTARNLGAASEGTIDACDWTNVTFIKAANPTT